MRHSWVIENQIYGSWSNFAEVQIARDYKLFSAIAFGNGGVTDDLPYPPRGLPPDHSNRVTELFFVEADSQMDLEDDDPDAVLKEELFKAWGDWAVEQFVTHRVVPGLDLHTPSWLNLNELETALTHAGLNIEGQSPQFRAVIAACGYWRKHTETIVFDWCFGLTAELYIQRTSYLSISWDNICRM